MNGAVQNLQRSINEQIFSKVTRLAATTAIDRARSESLASLQRLDPIMENTLRDDPVIWAVWQSARRVERSSSSKPAEDSQPPQPPVQQVPHTGAAAAQA